MRIDGDSTEWVLNSMCVKDKSSRRQRFKARIGGKVTWEDEGFDRVLDSAFVAIALFLSSLMTSNCD